MKVCPKCLLQYEDEENFCFNDGTVLDFLATSQETAVQPIVSTPLVNCRSCETENKANAKFCKKCGITLTATNEPIQIPFTAPSQQQATVVVQTTPPMAQSALTSFQPSHLLASSASDNTVKYIVGGLGLLIVLIFAGVFLYPSNKPKDTGGNTNKKSTKQSSDSEESSSNSTSDNSSPLIGKTGFLQMNAYLRNCPDRSCPSVGIHFENAKIKILEVQEKVNGGSWYKVQVLDYGCHTLNSEWCGKQYPLDKFDTERTYPLDSDRNAQDVGWVISFSKDLGKDVVRY